MSSSRRSALTIVRAGIGATPSGRLPGLSFRMRTYSYQPPLYHPPQRSSNLLWYATAGAGILLGGYFLSTDDARPPNPLGRSLALGQLGVRVLGALADGSEASSRAALIAAIAAAPELRHLLSSPRMCHLIIEEACHPARPCGPAHLASLRTLGALFTGDAASRAEVLVCMLPSHWVGLRRALLSTSPGSGGQEQIAPLLAVLCDVLDSTELCTLWAPRPATAALAVGTSAAAAEIEALSTLATPPSIAPDMEPALVRFCAASHLLGLRSLQRALQQTTLPPADAGQGAQLPLPVELRERLIRRSVEALEASRAASFQRIALQQEPGSADLATSGETAWLPPAEALLSASLLSCNEGGRSASLGRLLRLLPLWLCSSVVAAADSGASNEETRCALQVGALGLQLAVKATACAVGDPGNADGAAIRGSLAAAVFSCLPLLQAIAASRMQVGDLAPPGAGFTSPATPSALPFLPAVVSMLVAALDTRTPDGTAVPPLLKLEEALAPLSRRREVCAAADCGHCNGAVDRAQLVARVTALGASGRALPPVSAAANAAARVSEVVADNLILVAVEKTAAGAMPQLPAPHSPPSPPTAARMLSSEPHSDLLGFSEAPVLRLMDDLLSASPAARARSVLRGRFGAMLEGLALRSGGDAAGKSGPAPAGSAVGWVLQGWDPATGAPCAAVPSIVDMLLWGAGGGGPGSARSDCVRALSLLLAAPVGAGSPDPPHTITIAPLQLLIAQQWLVSCLYSAVQSLPTGAPLPPHASADLELVAPRAGRAVAATEFSRWYARHMDGRAGGSGPRARDGSAGVGGVGEPLLLQLPVSAAGEVLCGAGTPPLQLQPASLHGSLALDAAPPYVQLRVLERVRVLAEQGCLPSLHHNLALPLQLLLGPHRHGGRGGSSAGSSSVVTRPASPSESPGVSLPLLVHTLKALAFLAAGSGPSATQQALREAGVAYPLAFLAAVLTGAEAAMRGGAGLTMGAEARPVLHSDGSGGGMLAIRGGASASPPLSAPGSSRFGLLHSDTIAALRQCARLGANLTVPLLLKAQGISPSVTPFDTETTAAAVAAATTDRPADAAAPSFVDDATPAWHTLLLCAVQWTRSNDLKLRCHALRLLHNSTSQEHIGDSLFLLYDSTTAGAALGDAVAAVLSGSPLPAPPQRAERALDIVLLHGLQGAPLKTWRTPSTDALEPSQTAGGDTPNYAPSASARSLCVNAAEPLVTVVKQGQRMALWPVRWLAHDLESGLGLRVRVLAATYESEIWNRGAPARPIEGVEVVAADIKRQLREAGVGLAGGAGAVLISHSMGGILVKLLLDEEEAVQAPALPSTPAPSPMHPLCVVFYGTPHLGSPLASWSLQRLGAMHRWLGAANPAPPVSTLVHILNDPPQLLALNARFQRMVGVTRLPVLSLGEGLATHLPGVAGWTLPPPLPPTGGEGQQPPAPRRSSFLPAVPAMPSMREQLSTLIVPPSSADPGVGTFLLMRHSDHVQLCKPESPTDPRYAAVLQLIAEAVGSEAA